MQSGLRDLLEKRRNRAIAVVLGVKERECDGHLPAGVSASFRKVILDQFNEYHGVVMDVFESVINASASPVVLNDLYLAKLDQIHEGVTVLREVASRET